MGGSRQKRERGRERKKKWEGREAGTVTLETITSSLFCQSRRNPITKTIVSVRKLTRNERTERQSNRQTDETVTQ